MPVDYSLPYSGYGNTPFQAFTPTGVVNLTAGSELAFVNTAAIRVATDEVCQIRFTDGTLSAQNITLLAGKPVGIADTVNGFIFPNAAIVEIMGGEGVTTAPPQPAWILANGVWNDAGVWVDTQTWNDAAP